MKAKELLIKLKACEEAILWAEEKTVEEAWNTCEIGEWMLWFYAKSYPDNMRELTLAKGYCAQTVLHLMKDDRSKKAVQAAIDFGNGLISEDDLKADIYAAYAAAAAYADADAAADADADAAKKSNQLETANICRKYLHII